MHHYANVMRNYAVFRGRASRAEFWIYTLVVMILAVVVSVIDQGMIHPLSPMSGVLPSLFTLVHILPSLAVQVRRLHDIDRTGWWLLLNFTGIGAIVTLISALLRGTPGPNRYGAAQTGPEADFAVAHASQRESQTEPVFAAPQPALRAGSDHLGSESSGISQNATPSASQLQRDPIADIERLAKLRDSGDITEAEFDAMKRQLLGGGDGRDKQRLKKPATGL